MKKFLKIIVSLAIIGAFLYVYRSPLQTLFTRLEGVFLPCKNPITYKIESFDTRFGISKDYFLGALRDAETIWEKPISSQLFTYELAGNLKINLIYDYRQEATVKLQEMGLTLNDDKASYNILKAKYDVLKAVYAEDKVEFNSKLSDYQAHKIAYEKEVAYWNARDGAPKDEYDRLRADRAALDREIDELNILQDYLNEEVESINAMVAILNHLSTTLNLQVSKFNVIGESRGSEFEEGNYQSGPSGQQIDIYEFENRGKLVRVLAHELGHALGLDHLDDKNAIMYRLNNGINGKLTPTDLASLKKHCGIK